MNAHQTSPTRSIRLRLARLGHWPRRVLAGCLLATAGFSGLSGLSGRSAADGSGPSPPGSEVSVVAAARDLPAGTVLRLTDTRPVRLPAGSAPAHVFTGQAEVVGRRLAGPVRRGEPLTDARMSDPGLEATLGSGPDGRVAVPLRLSDPDATGLLHPGDLIDVLVAPDAAASVRPAVLVAAGLTVLEVPRPTDGPDVDLTAESTPLLVAASDDQARRLAGVSPDARVTVAIRPP